MYDGFLLADAISIDNQKCGGLEDGLGLLRLEVTG
jgi:hypothetical protein